MSNDTNLTVAPEPTESTPEKRYAFTKKQIIAAAATATTAVVATAAIVFLKAKGVEPSEVVEAAVEAAKETVTD